MDPSRRRRLALSLSWTPGQGRRKRWGLAFDPLPWLLPIAISAAVLAAAAGGKFALRRADLSGAAQAAHAPMEKPKPESLPQAGDAGKSAPGNALDEKPGDIITPLNVRDPSALVMGPSGYNPPPALVPDVKPQMVPPRKAKGKKLKNEDWRKQENYRF